VVFIPLSDDNPLRSIRFQWVTVGLIAANVLVFLWQSAGVGETAAASFALVPSELFQVKIFGGPARGPLDTLAVPEGYTLLTYMFLHGDILHLSSNMLFLWVFGDNVEDAMGHIKYLAFYLICGVAGGLAHCFMLPASKLPLIGASGAVAGVIAANVLVFLWQSAGLGETAAASFALVPSELFQVKIFGGPARGPLDTLAVPEGYTLLTYMFLHGEILHLSSNML